MSDICNAMLNTAKQRIRWLIEDMQQSILCVFDPQHPDDLDNDTITDIRCFVSRCSYTIETMPEVITLLMDNTGFMGEPDKWAGEEQVEKLCKDISVRLNVLHTEIVIHHELDGIQGLLTFEY